MRRFISVDLETSGLDPRRHEIIEVGLVIEEESGGLSEVEFSLPFDERRASAEALSINGWGTREFPPVKDPGLAVGMLCEILDGVHIVGKNPQFDTGFLTALFARFGEEPRWHHRLVDVGMLAWGRFNAHHDGSPPWQQPPNSELLLEWHGLPADGLHSALADARWAYQVFRECVPRLDVAASV